MAMEATHNFDPTIVEAALLGRDVRIFLQPDKEIEEKYRTYAFELASGKVVDGMILEETPKVVKVIVDPLAKAEATVLQKSRIVERVKLDVSTMPKALANRLSREEIMDLIAYVYSRGDEKHKLFHEHKH